MRPNLLSLAAIEYETRLYWGGRVKVLS